MQSEKFKIKKRKM